MYMYTYTDIHVHVNNDTSLTTAGTIYCVGVLVLITDSTRHHQKCVLFERSGG